MSDGTPLPNRTAETPVSGRNYPDDDPSGRRWSEIWRAAVEELNANALVSDLATNRLDYTPEDGTLFVPTDGGDWFIGDGSSWNNLGSIGEIDNHLADTTNPHNVTASQADALPTSGGTVTGDTTFGNTTHDSIDAEHVESISSQTSGLRYSAPNATSRKTNVDIEELWETFSIVEQGTGIFDANSYVTTLHAESVFDTPIDSYYAYVSDYQDTDIALYTAPHPEGPWSASGSVLTSPYTDDVIDKPSVIYTPRDSEVKLWYNSMEAPNKIAHCPVLATCPDTGDGTSWTNQGAVDEFDYPTGRNGRWDNWGANGLNVAKKDHIYYATYMSSDRYGTNEGQTVMGMAVSHDGLNWKRKIHPFGWGADLWENWDLETRAAATPPLHRLGDLLVMLVSGGDNVNEPGIFALPLDWYDRDLDPGHKLELDPGATYPTPRDSIEYGNRTYLLGNDIIAYVDWSNLA